jgi:Rieske 2Fe-2S family protein
MLFPSLLTSLQPDYLLTYRLTPLAAGRTRVVADVYFHPAALGPGFDADDVYAFWDRVNDEDRAICEDQQANAFSRAFEPSGYLDVEEGVEAFARMVAAVHESCAGRARP